MVASERLICASGDLIEGGRGCRFEAEVSGRREPAFVIRFRGRVFGYLNRCSHVPTELDWNPGEFFDFSQLYLICATHGALYDPQTGDCMGGRCDGKGLVPLSIVERDSGVYLQQEGG